MFDKCYYVLLYFQYSLSNVIDILANNECLFLRHSCFPKKGFAIFGGWPRTGVKWVGTEGMSQNRGFLFSENHFCHFRGMASEGCKMDRIMSQNRGFLFSEKRFCRKRDIKQPILLKNCKNGLKHVPKSGFLISRKKVLPKKGHAKKSRFSIFFKCTKTATRYMLTKMKPFSACQIWQNVIILLSYCYHLAMYVMNRDQLHYHLCCYIFSSKKALVEIWQMLSFCYHCY